MSGNYSTSKGGRRGTVRERHVNHADLKKGRLARLKAALPCLYHVDRLSFSEYKRAQGRNSCR